MTRYSIPATGGNPSSRAQGTTPGSFANAARVGTAWAFSSPDAPGMPAPSERTAWDFMPPGWTRGVDGRWCAPAGFQPITQLEFARTGVVTPEMRRVAEREGHLKPEQVRDEVAAGRLVIPANKVHLAKSLDPMAIGRAARTKWRSHSSRS